MFSLFTNGKQEPCKTKYNCKLCDKPHNTLLHFEIKKQSDNHNQGEITSVSSLIATKDEENLLATAIVRVKTKNGDKIGLRAVVDQGSQGTMLTEHALQKLGLSAEKVRAAVDGISGKESTKRVQLEVSPRFSDSFVLTTKALVLKKNHQFVSVQRRSKRV